MKEGEGVLVNEEIIYRGQFLNDLFHYYGKLEFKDTKSVYEGSFQFGKMHGKGKLTHLNYTYEGEF